MLKDPERTFCQYCKKLLDSFLTESYHPECYELVQNYKLEFSETTTICERIVGTGGIDAPPVSPMVEYREETLGIIITNSDGRRVDLTGCTLELIASGEAARPVMIQDAVYGTINLNLIDYEAVQHGNPQIRITFPDGSRSCIPLYLGQFRR